MKNLDKQLQKKEDKKMPKGAGIVIGFLFCYAIGHAMGGYTTLMLDVPKLCDITSLNKRGD